MQIIATMGTNTTYVYLRAGRDGTDILLALELVREKPSGFCDVEVLDAVRAASEDEAIDSASDLYGPAVRALDELNSLGRKDRGFGEAVERWFEDTSALMAA